MAKYSENDRVIAIGGLFQAARLARDIARNGICDASAFEAIRETLFDFEPASVESVFGGAGRVALGLRTLLRQLEQSGKRDLEVSRYVVAVMHLADRLMRSDESMQALHEELTALARRRKHFELGDSTLHEQLAEIYQTQISALGPRIMVRGEPLHLQNPDNATRIRVALLAGIRVAVLWRQAGGKKWQLLVRRRHISASARDIVDKNAD